MIDQLANLMNQYPLISNIVILALSFIIVIKASDLIVFGMSEYARKFGISDYLIGFLVIAVGMSLPEFMSAITGAVAKDSGIVFGTILGSNIITLTLVLGVLAIAGKKINLESKLLKETGNYMIPLAIFPFVLFINKYLSRIDGIILIAVFLGYVVMLWRKEGTFGKLKKDVKLEKFWKDALVFIGSLVALLLAARWLVFSSINIANQMHVSSYLIALTVIGIGASLPDLIVQIKAIKTGHHNIGFGNILGSTLAKMLLLLGIVALITPFQLNISKLLIALIFYVISMAFVLFLIKNKEMDYRHGMILVAIYLVFMALQICSEIGVI
ncbi:sodium:calcium antiporter [Candidatus Woesearchaeota archaeon]|nr:sodium:calcium antiporter [Candidatus Woesearchaeota archaeon]